MAPCFAKSRSLNVVQTRPSKVVRQAAKPAAKD
jgi:hypothetical protein